MVVMEIRVTVNYTRPDDDGGETVVSDLAALPEDDVLTSTRNEMPVPIRTSFFIRDGRAELGFQKVQKNPRASRQHTYQEPGKPEAVLGPTACLGQ